ncbi:MAG: response regulator [Planctomycetes bacterium]|nr:response regulator [Planctomycetota bacterium]
MHKVLIVEDAADLREAVAQALFQQGYRVKTAAHGVEAIRVGSRFRPEALVADWMLGGRIDGLAVAEALRVVQPALATVLISGYVSRDLEERAWAKGVPHLLKKPFTLAELQRVLRDALATASPQRRLLPVAALEIDADGAITFLNEAARALFRHVQGHIVSTRLESHFRGGIDLAAADHGWVNGVLDAPEPGRWSLSAHLDPSDGSRILLLHPAGAEHVRELARVRQLLGREPDPTGTVLAPLHVLVVDADPYARHRMTGALRAAGAICHGAANSAEADRLFAGDAEIGLVLLDLDGPPTARHALLKSFAAAGRHALLIGTSDRTTAPETAGPAVRHVIPKSWQLEDLIDILREN